MSVDGDTALIGAEYDDDNGTNSGSAYVFSLCNNTITVDIGGNCTLHDAITAANTDAPSGGCPAGCGHDIIILETDVALSSELPQITSPITIEGQGHPINGNMVAWSVLTVTTDGDLTLNEAEITGGNPSGDGGGIYNNGGTVKVTNSTVHGNSALTGGGGGIYNDNYGTLTLTNSTINGNSAGFGGGICSSVGTVTLTNSTISGNTASAGSGGGIGNGCSTFILTNSTVSGNSSSIYGGGICSGGGSVSLINSTVSRNTASDSGGGIYVAGGPAYLIGNTTDDSTSWNIDDPALRCLSSSVTLKSSLVSGGTAGSAGNEVYRFSGSVTADSYNVFGHGGETSADAFFDFTPGSKDVTATSDGTTPTLLGYILKTTLANNCGPAKPQTHALVEGSPAIDLDATCSTGLTTDQCGNPRPLGDGCDAGSFEGYIKNPFPFLLFLPSILKH